MVGGETLTRVRVLIIILVTALTTVLIVGFVVLARALPDKAERRAEFMQRCEKAKFATEQCAFLLAMAEKANSDADFSAIMNTATMGVAASSAMSSMSRK
jgi:hypothetical protein